MKPLMEERAASFVQVVESADGREVWSGLSEDAQAIVVGIGVHESRLRWDAIGDGGKACGAFQLHRHHWAGWKTCKDVLSAPRVVQLVLVRKALGEYIQSCPGSWERVLSAYASGTCGGALKVARDICGPVGVCGKKATLLR